MVVAEAGQVPPARIAPQLDQAGAELEPQQQPAEQPQHEHGRGHVGRAEEDGEESAAADIFV